MTILKALISGSMPDVCHRLGPPWFNPGFSLVLTFCELRAISFVSS